jgi:hypothetical protein
VVSSATLKSWNKKGTMGTPKLARNSTSTFFACCICVCLYIYVYMCHVKKEKTH